MVCHAGRWANARPFVFRAFRTMAEIDGLCRRARRQEVFRGKRLDPDEPSRRFSRAVTANPMLRVAVEEARAWVMAHAPEDASVSRTEPAERLNPCHVVLGGKILSIAGVQVGFDEATVDDKATKHFASIEARPESLSGAIERGDLISVRSLVEAEPELADLELTVRRNPPMKPRALAILAGRREIADYLAKMESTDR